MIINRIVFHAVLFLVSTGVFLQQMAIRSRAQETRSNEQIIRISAATFEFKPSEITLRKGVPVTFELISQDRHHGFKLAQFHLRADIQPGIVEKIRFVPDKVGNFTFFCDVFCGDEHEEMSGTIRVIE
jgi:cytochrome c oxidase subunit II